MVSKRRSLAWLALAVAVTGCLSTSGGVQLGNRWAGTPAQHFFESNLATTYNCVVCHTVGDRGGTVGPVLNNVGYRRSKDWLRSWLTDPNAVKNGTRMPKFPFSTAELDQAVEMLSSMRLDMTTDVILAAAGSAPEKGKRLFEDFDCFACHRVGDRGRTIGPDLTWIGRRKSQAWETNWLRDPPAFKPGTFMPDFHLSKPAIAALVSYLHTLAGQDNQEAVDWETLAGEFFGYTESEQGHLVFARLACAACHGQRLREGVSNPNAQPDGRVPAIDTVVGEMTAAELQQLVEGGLQAKKLDPSGPEPLYDCPSYPGALDQDSADSLLTYLKTLAPKKRKWRILPRNQ